MQTGFSAEALRSALTGMCADDSPARTAPPLYAGLLGSAWNELPTEIRSMHTFERDARAEGRCVVEAADGVEQWTRTFGAKSFSSGLRAGSRGSEGLLCERFGRFCFFVEIAHPLTGRIVRYRGWLARNDLRAGEAPRSR